MYLHQTSEAAPLDRRHDNRHKLKPTELARESLAFIIHEPANGIGGFLYTWVNGVGLAGSAVCLFGDSIGADPIFEVRDGIPVPDDMDFLNWHVGGLILRLNEPLHSASVRYQSDRVEVEYEFTANHQAYAYSTHPQGCPQWMADDRFEQQGTIQGFIKTDRVNIPFSALSLRDHSWGTRDWGVNQHWKWVHAQSETGIGVHFWKLFALGKEHLCGYVIKDGHMAQILSVDDGFACSEGLVPDSVKARIIDSSGRETIVSGSVQASFPFKVHDMITLFECPMMVEIDGDQGNGWMEMMWPNDLINYISGRITK